VSDKFRLADSDDTQKLSPLERVRVPTVRLSRFISATEFEQVTCDIEFYPVPPQTSEGATLISYLNGTEIWTVARRP
jgi:hypothetical protein